MSEIVIRPLSDLDCERELREIFFESSSKKDFKDNSEKEEFYWKYLGFYLTHHPELVFVAEREKVLGYCLGMTKSLDEDLEKLQAHLKVFEDVFTEYPAHLHINCHADARGQGIGTKLLQHFEEALQQIDITGVHIMTTPNSRNRSFYTRLGYSFEAQRNFNGRPLLLLGKKLA